MATITEIDTEISACITNKRKDYRIGEKVVTWHFYLEWLLKLRKQLLENPEVDIEVIEFDFNLDEFGSPA